MHANKPIKLLVSQAGLFVRECQKLTPTQKWFSSEIMNVLLEYLKVYNSLIYIKVFPMHTGVLF